MDFDPLLKPEGRVLPTLEADGSRRWLSPRLAPGKFWWRRRIVGYGLIGLFVALPLIEIGGKPAVLLDIGARRFTLLGYTFLPTDTFLLALLLVACVLGVFFLTAVFGRVWCGWGCPQTVYMEYVYRPLERLFLGRSGKGGPPRGELAAWRRPVMYAAYLVVSLLLANLFLAYFVGVEALATWVTQSPLRQPTGFIVVLVVTAAMMFNFAYFREQTCLIACPYGRLQAVLLDRESLIVRYDAARGEPRGKRRVPLAMVEGQGGARAGDCIDCTLCVQVCPTGIDIRDGLQMECVHCTQCMDACDAVMAKLRRPTGLIRYSSQAAAEGSAVRPLRPRVVVYGLMLTAVVSGLVFLIATKPGLDMMIVRNPGLPFRIAPDGRVENTLLVNLRNRTDVEQTYRLSLVGGVREAAVGVGGVELMQHELEVRLGPLETARQPIRLLAERAAFTGGRRSVTVRAEGPDGMVAERRVLIFGP